MMEFALTAVNYLFTYIASFVGVCNVIKYQNCKIECTVLKFWTEVSSFSDQHWQRNLNGEPHWTQVRIEPRDPSRT